MKQTFNRHQRPTNYFLLWLFLMPIHCGCAMLGDFGHQGSNVTDPLDQLASISNNPEPIAKSSRPYVIGLDTPRENFPRIAPAILQDATRSPDLELSESVSENISQQRHALLHPPAVETPNPLPPVPLPSLDRDQPYPNTIALVGGVGDSSPDSNGESNVLPQKGSASLTEKSIVNDPLRFDPALASDNLLGSPIDLGAVLGMSGAQDWAIQLARQRTVEAHADLMRAKSLWLPTLSFGIGWNKHEGRIQSTSGQVIKASRSSFFTGGGAALGSTPMAGGSGGPARLMADLALSDAIFQPKIADRMVSARRAEVSKTRNERLLQAGNGYVSLVESASQVANAAASLEAAAAMVQLTEAFERAGAVPKADVDRARTEHARFANILQDRMRKMKNDSAHLARMLQLDPTEVLQPVDRVIVPLRLTNDQSSAEDLIAMGISKRPEMLAQRQIIAARACQVKHAELDPFLPSVTLTTGGGSFQGGQGSSQRNQGSRSDIDLMAIWELDSLGLGVLADRKRACSQLETAQLRRSQLKDEIALQIVQAYNNIASYREQIKTAQTLLLNAEDSYRRNRTRVSESEGLPIELLQAIQARDHGLTEYTVAVAQHNRSQLHLLYATGQLIENY